MTIKEYIEKNKLTYREMGELCGVHYSAIYILALPKSHKSARKISLAIAQKIITATKGKVTIQDLLEIE